jgi:hypothetical protein
MPKQPHPFKSEYSEGSRTTLPDTAGVEQLAASAETPLTGKDGTLTSSVDVFIIKGPQTPTVGKPYGADKPRRVTIRGKISK